MPRRLKVFAARLGFYDTVVAVPSQAAALRAWGTRANLFADNVARVEDDAAAVEAALAHPGVPLRRGIGTGDPFSLDPRLPRLPPEDLADPPARRPGKSRTAEPPPPPPDRTALDAAERRLAAIDRRWDEREAGFRRRREALEAEEQEARHAHEGERQAAGAERDRAAERFEEASRRAGRRTR